MPGPGTYSDKATSFNIEGKFPTSKFKNATTIVFGVSKEPRFKYGSKNSLFINY
jgi:hypothetical protein